MSIKTDLFCLADGQVHAFTIGELERLVYTLQGMEHDAGFGDRRDPATLDEHDCLREVLAAAYEVEAYQEHTTQQLLRRRDLAGPRPGDEDLCRHCGENIKYIATPGGRQDIIARWEHLDTHAWVKCRQPEPDPERQP